jgi:two-component system, OmpR family, sensor histidine kinase KdpD
MSIYPGLAGFLIACISLIDNPAYNEAMTRGINRSVSAPANSGAADQAHRQDQNAARGTLPGNLAGRPGRAGRPAAFWPVPGHGRPWLPYFLTLLVVALNTGLARVLLPYLAPSNLIMVYLLGVVAVAAAYGRGPAVVASLASVAAFDFFFVPPVLSFAVSDLQYLFVFGAMLVVALVIAGLTARLRQQALAAVAREQRTAALSEVSRTLANQPRVGDSLAMAMGYVGQLFDGQAVALLPDSAGELAPHEEEKAPAALGPAERGIARWAYERGELAGWDTERLPQATALYMPLVGSGPALGVIALIPKNRDRPLEPEECDLLQTLISQIALALERAQLTENAQKAQLQIETERLRVSLLSSISHDLRTPLAAITGSISSLIESDERLDAATRRELLVSVYEGVFRLNRQVINTLEMTRLESGSVELRKGWYSLEELAGAALSRPDDRLRDRTVITDLPDDLPLVSCDPVLIDQVLLNLLDNALKYTPPDSPIEISARVVQGTVQVDIADRGPGVPPGEEERVFDKFFRAQPARGSSGVGLGLSICRAAMRVHGGRIWAENRPGGGARFSFTLPLLEQPPAEEAELDEDELAHVSQHSGETVYAS